MRKPGCCSFGASRRRAFFVLSALLVACNEDSARLDLQGGFGPPPNEGPRTPGNAVDVHAPDEAASAFDALGSELEAVASMSHSDLKSAHPMRSEPLGYSAGAAQHLDLIQRSPLSLDDDELGALSENGFVISARQEFPSFSHGYETLYMSDLPLFISADSLLDALHRSYDEMLKIVEQGILMQELSLQLRDLRDALPSLDAEATTKQDLDFYLAVALGLLQEEDVSPVAGGREATIKSFIRRAREANGLESVVIFDVPREIDFSQFTPRGHYTDSLELERYFRAMMWLGRIDFRLIETQSDGSQVFHRRQFDAVRALGELFSVTGFERYERIDRLIAAFVGDSDYMTVPEIGELMAALGGAPAMREASDETIAQTILDNGYGSQSIASHFIVNATPDATLPLNRSFALFGQRYVIDSHVFSNVVFDRTRSMRMMPDPLDVAFAALGNDAALPLLDVELSRYGYAGNLGAVRFLADEHDDAFWGNNLYNLWLSGLRSLSTSPSDAVALTRTEPWSRRVLNTQLASWAQLRHDTILYAKQSYTSGAVCEFPDAFVDPYPEFYAALQRYAEYGQTTIAELTADATALHYREEQSLPLGESIALYFASLNAVATTLKEMAEYQEDGIPFTSEHMAFVNRAVAVAFQVCGGPPTYTGWYTDLFFSSHTAAEFDPTIADVHTQPTDEAGNLVGKVLHVGTGNARLMVVTADTCEGPKAYAGLASSYYEAVTRDFERLTDSDWSERLQGGDPPGSVPWLRDIVVE